MYSIKHIVSVLKSTSVLNYPEADISYLLTDSRRIFSPSDSLFFALHTSKRDGHRFIKELYSQGIKSFVVENNFEVSEFPDANFLFVNNTLTALQTLAAFHRSNFNYPVIGITGSNGKTIVKEWLYQLLSPDRNIVRSPRSYNSQIGVPLSVWQMNKDVDTGIFEAGISTGHEMEHLQKIIQPTIGILTNIGEAHAEGFKNNLQKAKEKIGLFKDAEILFCNADDAIIQQAIPARHKYSIFSWGKTDHATLQIISIEKFQKHTIITVKYHHQKIAVTILFPDDASVQNAIICLCVMLYLNKNESIIQQRIKKLQPVEMRLQLIQAVNNCSLVNDSYSFDITSFGIALDFLLQQQQHPKKTVIISDLPLHAAHERYREVVAMLQSKKINRIIAIGSNWLQMQDLLTGNNFAAKFYESTESFIHLFNTNHFRNESILLKGARIFKFEKIVTLLEKKVHQTVMEINLTALTHNLNQFQKLLNPGIKLMVMVKAFGYGSGSAEIAGILQFHRVDYLAVAYADEGVELRNAGIRLPILVMNVDEATFETIIQYNLEPELFSMNIFKSFNNFLSRQGLQQYPVHLKIDTGMHRLGFEEENLNRLCRNLAGNRSIIIRSVFTHLAASEDAREDAFTLKQVDMFKRCCEKIASAVKYSFLRHVANTAAIIRFPELQFDMVRLGIGLYGIENVSKKSPSLQNVCTLKTTIAQIRKVKAGETIGYNRKGKAKHDSVIATLRIGYADGFSRKFSNGIGKVFLKSTLAPVIGNVCMDMIMVDITNISLVHEDDEVEIFGKNLPVVQLARWCKTIPYELLTVIGQRVKRIYIEE